MKYDLILAGVGGQGILTIAQLITRAASQRGWQVRQSEVHGMSQRGGAVQSHVRIADHAIHSATIPRGSADLIIAVEPLEALRYVEYLSPRGAVVASAKPIENMASYPSLSGVLEDIARSGRHAVIDAAKLARDAGSQVAENVVMLGAASRFMPFESRDFDESIAGTFAAKGKRIVDVNRRAFALGRAAAGDSGTCEGARVVDEILAQAGNAARCQLFEHEVYQVLESIGLQAPAHRFLPAGTTAVAASDLEQFAGTRIVLKLVSGAVVHKSDSGAAVVVEKSADVVNAAISAMLARHRSVPVEGVLLVEFVPHATDGLGGELFVGFRDTREFGPVLAAGLGGTQTELLASRLLPGRSIATAPILTTTAEQFLELFKGTLAYELISGSARGARRLVADETLCKCFAVMIGLARQFCSDGSREQGIVELEVNPFAVADERLVPLDGRARVGRLTRRQKPRPANAVERMIEPRSIAVLGVSATRANFGRIVLDNILSSGFDPGQLYVIKDGCSSIAGVRCVPSLQSLPETVDLLIAATPAEQTGTLVRDLVADPTRCASAILISGGIGEKEGTEHTLGDLRQLLATRENRPAFLGTNSMGLRSRPGRFDTFFIPPAKQGVGPDTKLARLALISQSGAFIITRLSNLKFIDPAIAVSLGNQLDLTVSDFVHAVARRDDIDCIGVYVEGFNELDGLETLHAVRRARLAGKAVVFYKAGRTPAGRTAVQGHTASLAGDWSVCMTAMQQAGAMVACSFQEFEQMLLLATSLHSKLVNGTRVAAISNAGYETVGMADAAGVDAGFELSVLSDDTCSQLSAVLAEERLGHLVNPRNPVDLTPMASDAAYERAARVLLEAPETDALIVAAVPMSPQMLTTAEEMDRPGSIANRVVSLFNESGKPLVFVVDSDGPYAPLADRVRRAGVPVFRSADHAIACLGMYLAYRCSGSTGKSLS